MTPHRHQPGGVWRTVTAVTSWTVTLVQTAPQRVVWALRGGLLLLCVLAASVRGHVVPALCFAVAMLAVAAVGGRVTADSLLGRLARAVELLLACVAIAVTGQSDSAFVMYLTVPVVAAGLFCGALDAVLMSVLGATVLVGLAARSRDFTVSAFATTIGQYVLLATAVGLVAAWARHLLRTQTAVQQPLFGTAYRLLTELRIVARQLPGTLDPVTVASQLLDEVGGLIPVRYGAVFGRMGAGRLVALAGNPEDAPHWDVEISGTSPFAEAWLTQERRLVSVDGRWLAVVPLLVGLRTVGVVALESDDPPPPPAVLDQVSTRCQDAALRIETALLFNDIRDIATTEERQRLAREIHDGIAQELVIVGYGIDNVLAELPADDTKARAELIRLRAEVTRIISELRMSLFDLRSHIDPQGGLGSAIASYLRTIGTASGVTVHITLNESPQRLPAATEAELFRIAQEAVTNARKHARASNIWVTVDVDPPMAAIVVEDDGVGIGIGRIGRAGTHGSYGQAIMRERAERMAAELEIGPRAEGGTRVAVRLGGSSRQRSSAAAPERARETG